MGFVSDFASMGRDFVKRTTIGEHIDNALQQVGRLCHTGQLDEAHKWSVVVVTAHNDCHTLAETCAKVAFVAFALTYTLPFLFGSLFSSITLTSLALCVLTHDVAKIIDRFAKLDEGDRSLIPSFNGCSTMAARLNFMTQSTTFLKFVPTGWVEKLGSALAFIPRESV